MEREKKFNFRKLFLRIIVVIAILTFFLVLSFLLLLLLKLNPSPSSSCSSPFLSELWFNLFPTDFEFEYVVLPHCYNIFGFPVHELTAMLFLVFTSIFATAILSVLIFRRKRGERKKWVVILKRSFVVVSLYCLSTVFLMLPFHISLEIFNVVYLFPFVYLLSILPTFFLARAFFREEEKESVV